MPVAQRVTGIVDFGDMVVQSHGERRGDCDGVRGLDTARSAGRGRHVAAGYHAIHPLTEDEIAALFGLMGMRLCLSVCLAAKQQAERPDVDYLGISQAPIRRTLPALAAIHPRLAHYGCATRAAFRRFRTRLA